MRKWQYLSLSLCALLSGNMLIAQESGNITGGGQERNTQERNAKKEFAEKEIQQEISVGKNADILIETESRSLEIKTWDQPKVKVSAKISVSGGSDLKDEDWFERLNISVKTLGSSVRILARQGVSSYSYSGSNGGVVLFDGDGRAAGLNRGAKRVITIYVPGDARLEAETKYGSLKLDGNIAAAKLISTSGNIEAGDIDRLTARSKYGNILVGNVKNAEIEITSGHFTAKNIDRLDIDSKYAAIEMASLKDATIRSTNDDYDIDEAGSLQGRKAYGSLRINTLKKSLDVDGANADIKLRNIATSTESIKINNKYADLRLPVRDLKAFSVDMQGKYNTVYASFEKKPVIDADQSSSATGNKTDSLVGNGSRGTGSRITVNRSGGQVLVNRSFLNSDDDTPPHFTAQVGDGKGTRFSITCNSCTVDFK